MADQTACNVVENPIVISDKGFTSVCKRDKHFQGRTPIAKNLCPNMLRERILENQKTSETSLRVAPLVGVKVSDQKRQNFFVKKEIRLILVVIPDATPSENDNT